MNIFVTDPCPQQCAKNLDDKRVVKMVLETAQMLSTSLRFHGCTDCELYKSTHINHPCSIWSRTSRDNFEWLLTHLGALLSEYEKRYCKTHVCYDLYNTIYDFRKQVPEGALTPFANCAANKSLNLDFKSEQDVFKAYKMYLTERWNNDKRKPTWYGKEERPF